MKKSNMYQLNKKVWALILVAVMIATMIPLVAFADSEQTGKQIGAYFEVNDATGELPDNPTSGFTSGTEQSYEDGKVKVNKTITPTEQENVFNIDLTVSTQEKITQTTTSADAAAVIVIDCSGSMVTSSENRLAAAKEAAQTFINEFVEANASRKIAIVRFSGSEQSNNIDGATTVQSWTDASNLQKSDGSYCDAIGDLTAKGGTNIEAGLILARNLLNKKLYNDLNEEITNKNLIFISDGKPTFGVNTSEETTDSIEVVCNATTSSSSENMTGDGESTTCEDITYGSSWWGEPTTIENDTHKDAEQIALDMKDSGINTYAVYIGNQTVDCDDCSLNMSGSDWLSSKCGFTSYSASKLEDLVGIFEGIADLIALKTQAWIVEDPMGENIEFVSWDANGNNEGALTAPKDNDNVLEWNIKDKWLPVEKTETEDEVTTYTYKLSYQIRLDTLAENYEACKYYAANGVTSLLYYIENTEGGETTATTGTAYFNVPSVKGYAGTLTFNKVNNFGDELAGAEFKLSHKDGCCDDVQVEGAVWATATSDSDGKVSFADVPSGHKYVLTETKAPDGYVADNKEYEVTVSYGKATIAGMTDNKVINNPVTTEVDVAKKVTGTLGDVNKGFNFKAKAVDRNGNVYTVPAGEGYTVSDDNVIEFTLKHGEVITIKDLPVGATLQIEETNALGYDKVMSAADTKGTESSADDTAVEVTSANNGGSVIVKGNLKVTVTNDKSPLIDTGFTDNINVYLIMILIVAIAAISVVLYKTRRREA